MSLKPWREVITPHPDVAAGRYQQAEFAADLAQVVAGAAEAEYGDPAEFFARTYLTEGMRRLLVTAVERVMGRGGEPVVQLKTAFGGGKTHTMLALYHLLGGKARAEQMAGAVDVLREARESELPRARFAVIVGTAPNPTRPRDVRGVTVNTLWGDIAAQLGGEPAYRLVEQADRQGTAPGSDDLFTLFEEFGPAIVLIDELVAYIRNLPQSPGLVAGTFDSNLTFVQSLTEAVKRCRRSMLVASIPESDIEVGGPAGKAALERLEHTFGRLEAIWKPVGATEGFEIVRRRLFTPVKDAAARDEACRAFMALYDENPADFPPETKEAGYLDRLRSAYPIHPELFDRLYEDWSSLERFQRTRGVLRLMANVIHELWSRDDRSLFIMPGSLPLDAPQVKNELLRYLSEGWNAIVDKDVESEPKAVDATNPRFGAAVAARRVARAIFLGSAPHVHQQKVRGVEDVRVRLGVVQPGESVAVFNDALGRLMDKLTYLYGGNRRYWYDTQPNLRRTMQDRAGRLEWPDVEAEIVRRLRSGRERGDFRAVHVCPTSGDVPDEQEARLVILLPSAPHRNNRTPSVPANTPALTAATEILDRRGNGPRTHRNMLVFVAADGEQVKDLEQDVRQYLAWTSILNDADTLNLDAHQAREAQQGLARSDETAGTRLNDAYCWLLVPVQEGAEPLTWEVTRIAGGQESPVLKATRKVRSAQQLITQWSPVMLRMELDRWLWKDEPHVSLKRVWDCLTTYLYLPRVRNQDVFLAAVRDGLRTRDYFAYAGSVTPDGKYQGLQFGAGSGSIYVDGQSVLIKPEAAQRQLDAEAAKQAQTTANGGASGGSYAGTQTGHDGVTVRNGGPNVGLEGVSLVEVQPRKPTRFYGSVELGAQRLGRDAGQIAEEVVQHLAGLVGADVSITLEIRATIPDGVPDNIVRTVTENCRTLRFTSQEFERD